MAIMADEKLRSYLMDIFQTFDKFTIVAERLMKINMENAKKASEFDGTEEHLAAMVARAHNAEIGYMNRPLSELRKNQYVSRFLGFESNEGPSGDWPSLRCVESFGDDNTVRPGTQGVGIGGLELKPLVLN